MRPISGTGSVLSAPNMRDAAAASRMFSSSENATVFAIQLMSAPAQNDLPAPLNTTARTSGSLWIVDAHAVSSAISSSLNALRTSGRFSETYSTGPSRRTIRWLNMRPLHSEDAEARFRNRRIAGDRQAERERRSCVDRIENPVVPQPGSGVVGRAFVLVLLQNGLAQRL